MADYIMHETGGENPTIALLRKETIGGQTVYVEDLKTPLSTTDELENKVNDLEKWKGEQETALPDGVIKGIKEIENFLSGNSDSEQLAVLLANLADSLRQIRSGVKVIYNTETGIKTFEPIGITTITTETIGEQDEQTV